MGPTPTRTLPHQGGGELFESDVHKIPPPLSRERNGACYGTQVRLYQC
jgi:hypothetical protein